MPGKSRHFGHFARTGGFLRKQEVAVSRFLVQALPHALSRAQFTPQLPNVQGTPRSDDLDRLAADRGATMAA
jgi:hypothetical protein